MTYRCADVVRLAGHSSPTVAQASLMTRHGLRALYGAARCGVFRVKTPWCLTPKWTVCWPCGGATPGQALTVQLDTSVVPWAPALRMLFPKAVAEQASAEELAQFAELWQEQVRRMLIDHGDDPRMVRVRDGLPSA